MKRDTLNILIGAGFSFKAGLPLVKDVDQAFDSDLRGKLLRFSSSEWDWYELQNQVGQNNGRLSVSVPVIEEVFMVMIDSYKAEVGSFINYEDFFSFLQKQDSGWFEAIYQKAQNQFVDHFKNVRSLDELKKTEEYKYFGQNNFNEVFHSFQFLLAALLRPKISYEEILTVYKPFLDFISQYEKVNFFTLNHDLLLERMLGNLSIPYSNGFSNKNSVLRQDDGELIPTFQDDFQSNYSIFKLHGSVDLNGFIVTELEGHMNMRTGEIIYCIPNSIHDVHRFNPDTDEIVQDMNFEIAPNFLTGVTKTDFVKKDPMYSCLYNHFNRALKGTDDVLIIGYSFGDPHIEEVLKRSNAKRIINVNPSLKYPHSSNCANLPDIDSLK